MRLRTMPWWLPAVAVLMGADGGPTLQAAPSPKPAASPEPGSPPRAAAAPVPTPPRPVPPAPLSGNQSISLPLADFKNIDHDSASKDRYYRVASEAGHSYLAADFQPSMDAVTLGYKLPDNFRKSESRVSWRWRVRSFPRGGDECYGDRGDSAAGVFLTFHRGLKWTLLKYIWSESEPAGTVCDKRSNMFVARQTTILERAGELGVWREESLDPKAEYAKHFGGSPDDAPELVGVGLITDGDQTKSVSAADYSDFVLEARTKP